jgi:AcrR family transcriptional regulator
MDPARRTSKKAQQTASLILDAAEQLMIQERYHNFSIRKVATRAGVTVGNLQYHFATKASLIEAMLDHCIARYLELFAPTRAESGGAPPRTTQTPSACHF